MLVVKANIVCKQKQPTLTVISFLEYLCSHCTGGAKNCKEINVKKYFKWIAAKPLKEKEADRPRDKERTKGLELKEHV